MSYTDRVTTQLRTLRFPRTQPERLALALGTTAVLGTSLIFPAIYRDYRTFRSYGPGGVPNNVVGWLIVRLLFQPFADEMLSTDIYVRRVDAVEGHGQGDGGFLSLTPGQARSITDRPVVGPHVVPQRQLTQIPDVDIMEVSLGSVLFESILLLFHVS